MQECKAACIKLNIGRVMPLEFDSHSPIHTHGPMAAMQGTHPTHEDLGFLLKAFCPVLAGKKLTLVLR